MFFTATITDKANAPAIRRQLKRAGFSYNPFFKEWIKNPMSLRGARLDLPSVKAIAGIEYQLVPVAEHQARINADVSQRASK